PDNGDRILSWDIISAYHQASICTPTAMPRTASWSVAAAIWPRNASDQCAQVANARRDGRLRNLNSGVIWGATVSLNNDPPGRAPCSVGAQPASSGIEKNRPSFRTGRAPTDTQRIRLSEVAPLSSS